MTERTRQYGVNSLEDLPKEGLVIFGDGEDIFIILDGVKIAKRGHPGTPYAGTWVSLEPGYTVRDCQGTVFSEDGEEGSEIEVEYNGVRVH